jgi:hypothetical protein
MKRVTRLAFVVAVTLAAAACAAAEKLVNSVGGGGGGGTCNGPAALATSGTASGSTKGVACKFPDGSQGNLYTLTPSQPANVQVTVTPTGFAPWLGAWTSTGTLVAATNASPARLRLFLAPGAYQLGVSSVGGSGDGNFTVTTASAELSGCKAGPGGGITGEDTGMAMKGAVITGAVTDADCGSGTVRTDTYGLFGATAGSSWSFNLTVDRAASIAILSGSQTVAAKTTNTAGTISVTVTVPQPLSDFRMSVYGTPGSSAINYTLSIN